jgi:hypothetical protein
MKNGQALSKTVATFTSSAAAEEIPAKPENKKNSSQQILIKSRSYLLKYP